MDVTVDSQAVDTTETQEGAGGENTSTTQPETQPDTTPSGLTVEQVKELLAADRAALLAELKPKEESTDDAPPEDPQLVEMREALQELHEANISGLSEEHKKLVADLGGESVVAQVKVLAKLKASGVIKGTSAPSSTPNEGGDGKKPETPTEKPPRSKLDLSGNAGDNKTPQTWAEADAEFEQALAASKR